MEDDNEDGRGFMSMWELRPAVRRKGERRDLTNLAAMEEKKRKGSKTLGLVKIFSVPFFSNDEVL